jgi:hypothetical protein
MLLEKKGVNAIFLQKSPTLDVLFNRSIVPSQYVHSSAYP